MIREVAKKLFIALRADASYFENEFALARLASDRWTKAEARLLNSKESNQSKKSMTAGKGIAYSLFISYHVFVMFVLPPSFMCFSQNYYIILPIESSSLSVLLSSCNSISTELSHMG